ncbi:cytochrome ubiquinol oxidase subunit I [Henriciella mobilis]|uniref:cytochrome ubiquinol oxidase subunit I n=1 Tax=Henriciella mobilis TaxID=2305467 RepID=UPI000E674F8A|nr:cytochrome ubiquinol oxidase subunit I [Henriciella mobilis]RIJ14052.1 cytochrome ubiquinol oxidase subunit I [Henriciella mobilis]RIJ20696.1 cytochrome ubiquinol oxidase subunit I [Henriciella mobilis]
MEFDALLLSRIQFGFVIAFHILFPAFTIGLAAFLAVCEGMWLRTGREVYKGLYLHWVKIFALAFAMGVVSGVVMSYQFGTNWSVFADRTGSVLGPLLGYEVLTAFFLEATFLGVMLFGWNKAGRKLHFAATCAVAIGTSISAFWILSANSWMQTPQGFAVDPVTGNFYATDWLKVIFNPSFPSRYVHMMLAAYATTAAVVLAAGAWQILRGQNSEPTQWQIRMAALTLAAVMPFQIAAGHWSGEVAHEHQPAKIAVVEAWCDTKAVQGTAIVAWPADNECGLASVEIPGTSPLLFPKANGDLQGLDAFDASETPPIWIPFWSFRIMVAAGLAMLALGVWGLFLWWRRRIDQPGLFHWLAVPGGSLGFIAVLTGWMVAEVGRQPYTVYGHLRTEDSVAPVETAAVATSLLVFMVVYAIVFTAGSVYMARIATRGFTDDPTDTPRGERRAPGSPLGAVDDPAEELPPETAVADRRKN